MLLSFENVTFGYTDVPILEDVCLTLYENERVGLVGGNGEGKTTLIKLMLKELSPDKGTITAKNGVRVGYLEQSGSFITGTTVYETMREVFARDDELVALLRETEEKMTTATEAELKILSSKYESLLKQIQARDSYHVDVKIKTVLGGMGFLNRLNQSVATLSGGEKTKLKFCRLLLEEPDLLILDEPTNHLDVKTLFWLEDYLGTYKGTLFVVSHDRYFLDRLTTRTVEIERGRVTTFKGNYAKYKLLKEERLKEAWRVYEKQCEELARLQDYVDRNLVRATTAKSALSRVKKIEKMGEPEKPVPPPQAPRFSFSYDERPYENVLTAERFDLTAGEKTLLTGAEFALVRGEKCAILGDNGAGKTTLLKYLLAPNSKVKFARFTRVAYYDQENAELDKNERVLDAFWGKYTLMSQTDARKLLAQSGIAAEDIDKTTGQLSGGERAKLALALLQAQRGNLLVLDEPTNHLDLPAREALEDALKAFDGTLLFISHDRRFIEAIANKIVTLENGKLTVFAGGYGDYLESKKAPSPLPEKKEKEEKEEKTDGSYRSKEERARETKRRTRIKEIELRLEELEREEERLNTELAAHASDYAKVSEISKNLEALHTESEALYEEYGELI